MRTGVTLATIRNEVLIEAGFSTEAGHATFSRERLNQLINRTERTMSTMDDWPSNQVEEDVAVVADDRYVNLPTNLNFTEIDTVHVLYGDEYLPVAYGIRAEHRSIHGPTDKTSPIQRWEVRSPGNVDFEIWPVSPGSQTLRFEGTKSIGTMAKDNDTCTLDADVIVLRVAAQILGRDRKEDAALLLQEARDLTNMILKRQEAARTEDINLGHRPQRRWRPGIDYIPQGS